ncbi:helix-turn-helix domain-containing protein [Pseudomonas machongensis]
MPSASSRTWRRPSHDGFPPELTAVAGLSVALLERGIFNLTPRHLILPAKAERTEQLLRTEAPIAEITAAAGYTDHSALNRQFKALTGSSPRHFRQALPT